MLRRQGRRRESRLVGYATVRPGSGSSRPSPSTSSAQLLPETRELAISRCELPNLGAVNFVIRGLLGAGATSTLRLDAQARRSVNDCAHAAPRCRIHW
ncbi:AtuA-related protein [Kribbella rubisoli]|uniref:AtuA-related protein n=1 Tax=Kribbella rubisoli TaxID=3075929 RepID=UPI003BB00DCB